MGKGLRLGVLFILTTIVLSSSVSAGFWDWLFPTKEDAVQKQQFEDSLRAQITEQVKEELSKETPTVVVKYQCSDGSVKEKLEDCPILKASEPLQCPKCETCNAELQQDLIENKEQKNSTQNQSLRKNCRELDGYICQVEDNCATEWLDSTDSYCCKYHCNCESNDLNECKNDLPLPELNIQKIDKTRDQLRSEEDQLRQKGEEEIKPVTDEMQSLSWGSLKSKYESEREWDLSKEREKYEELKKKINDMQDSLQDKTQPLNYKQGLISDWERWKEAKQKYEKKEISYKDLKQIKEKIECNFNHHQSSEYEEWQKRFYEENRKRGWRVQEIQYEMAKIRAANPQYSYNETLVAKLKVLGDEYSSVRSTKHFEEQTEESRALYEKHCGHLSSAS